jgi:L-2,4-diaminobutyrate transaminase
VANLKLIDELDLIANNRDVGTYLNKTMADAVADHPHVGEVRGEGMICAVEFVKDKDSRTFFEASEKVGARISGALAADHVIARAMPQGDILGFAPPFCLTKAEADEVVQKTAKAVKSVLG